MSETVFMYMCVAFAVFYFLVLLFFVSLFSPSTLTVIVVVLCGFFVFCFICFHRRFSVHLYQVFVYIWIYYDCTYLVSASHVLYTLKLALCTYYTKLYGRAQTDEVMFSCPQSNVTYNDIC